ncbi:hypothetical protein A2159_01335 [Candidatus Woesebacteria bacterium RBG_13_34_9]|uniref:Uncharacterized protein n=1 Tax=Candidatus Woesebacteria bacterium RBG_13_34_9 TaxID=1802477 RepID=A0A1F7X832_9BACT|nr:MAG: hypothetical protein A2159_01335 [Candidatus Woesebacteria bacterium RBG_13_34_9]
MKKTFTIFLIFLGCFFIFNNTKAVIFTSIGEISSTLSVGNTLSQNYYFTNVLGNNGHLTNYDYTAGGGDNGRKWKLNVETTINSIRVYIKNSTSSPIYIQPIIGWLSYGYICPNSATSSYGIGYWEVPANYDGYFFMECQDVSLAVASNTVPHMPIPADTNFDFSVISNSTYYLKYYGNSVDLGEAWNFYHATSGASNYIDPAIYEIYLNLNGNSTGQNECSDYTNLYDCLYEGSNQSPTGRCIWDNLTGTCGPAYQELLLGDTMDLLPYAPIDCYFTKINNATPTLDFISSGEFTNPKVLDDGSSNPYVFTELDIIFTNKDGNSSTTELSMSTTSADSAFAWSTYISLVLDTYQVKYEVKGFNIKTGVPYTFSHYCPGTGIGIEFPTGNIDWWGTRSYLSCQNFYNDCIASSTSFTDTVICRLQGLFISLYCPDPVILSKASAIIDNLKTRFPYSYIMVAKNAFMISTSTLATSTATTTYISGENLSGPFAKLGTIPEIAAIRTVLMYMFLFSLLFFIIKFTKTGFLK